MQKAMNGIKRNPEKLLLAATKNVMKKKMNKRKVKFFNDDDS